VFESPEVVWKADFLSSKEALVWMLGVAVLGSSSELSSDSAPSNLEFFKYFVGVTLEATWTLFDGLDNQ
jgi:hypothetical protein